MENDNELEAVEYLIGNLSPDERRAFDEQIAKDPETQRTVEYWAVKFSPLLNGTYGIAPTMGPPPYLWSRIEKQIAPSLLRDHKTPDAPSRKRGLRDLIPSPWSWSTGFASGFAFAAVIALFSGAVDATRPFVTHKAEVAISGQLASHVRLLSGPWPAAEIETSHLHPQPDGSLELWLIRPSAAPLSLGLIDDDRRYIWLDSSLDMPCDTRIAVSLEPQGGSREPGPSGPVLASAHFHEF